MPTELQFPAIFVLPVHLQPDRLHELEERIPTITYNINEADVILGNISKPERALFELRRRKVSFEPTQSHLDSTGPDPKRRKVSEAQSERPSNLLQIARLEWLSDSLEQKRVLPLDDYLILEVTKKTPAPGSRRTPVVSNSTIPGSAAERTPGSSPRKRPLLLQKSTSDDSSLPPVPDFLHTAYSCQRPTPLEPPNSSFIDLLKKIRKQRILNGDQVGVRAYSTSIASLAAYPYLLQSPHGKHSRRRQQGQPLLKGYHGLSGNIVSMAEWKHYPPWIGH